MSLDTDKQAIEHAILGFRDQCIGPINILSREIKEMSDLYILLYKTDCIAKQTKNYRLPFKNPSIRQLDIFIKRHDRLLNRVFSMKHAIKFEPTITTASLFNQNIY